MTDSLISREVLHELKDNRSIEEQLRDHYRDLFRLYQGFFVDVNTGDITVKGKLDMNGNPITNVDYIDFDLINGVAPAEGRMIWNDADGTLNLGLKGGVVNLQIGLEEVIRATNNSGGTLLNGTPVYISGATGNNVTIGVADADFATGVGVRTIGLVTEDIDDSQKGYVTTAGLVRDINTDMFAAAGLPVYLAKGGGFATAPPTPPDTTYIIGIVVRKHATEGIILVIQTLLPYVENLSDVLVSSISDAQILAWDNSDSRWENKTPTSHTQLAFSMYDAEPARSSETSLDGAFSPIATAQPLDSVPTDLVVSKGTGKIVVVVNAGSDFDGEITVTGDSVDRDTGAVTIADTDTLTIDALTTDNSDVDLNGNIRHAFIGAYITSKWFVGTVTLSTTNLTLTDVDVYHVSFEQFDDTADITLDTFDTNLLTTSINAEFDAYLYSIEVINDKCNITREASLNVGAEGETAIADRYWRLRRGNINKAINGTTDGTWVDIHYSNSPAFVEDVSIKVWATEVVPLTLDP